MLMGFAGKLRYYQALFKLRGPAGASGRLLAAGAACGPLVTSDDSALAAFALLAARVVNKQRALISLLDKETQYVLAESTRSLSMAAPYTHGPCDQLWLGGRLERPHRDTLSATTLTLPPNGIMEIRALDEHDTFRHMSYVAGEPMLRYYCGVQLRTRSGFPIGSLCVVDQQPFPEGMSEVDRANFLQLARTITDYLEHVASEMDLRREKKMETGLARFIAGAQPEKVALNQPRDGRLRVEGKFEEEARLEASRAKAVLQQGERAVQRMRTRHDEDERQKERVQGQTRVLQAHETPTKPLMPVLPRRTSSTPPASASRQLQPSDTDREIDHLLRTRTTAFDGHVHFGALFPAVPSKEDGRTDRDASEQAQLEAEWEQETAQFDFSFLNAEPAMSSGASTARTGSVNPSPPNEPTNCVRGRNSAAASLGTALRSVFTRAALLIRESLETEGCLFLNPDLEGIYEMAPNVTDATHISSDARVEREMRRKRPRQLRRTSGVLGYATAHGSSPPDEQYSLVPPPVEELGFDASELQEEFLKLLIDSWPQGRIFSFSNHPQFPIVGSPISERGKDTVSAAEEVSRLDGLRFKEVEMLRKFLPGSTSLIFVPLYDFVGYLYAVGIAWTTAKTRAFRGNLEGAYMKSFSEYIMAEVNRIHSVSGKSAATKFEPTSNQSQLSAQRATSSAPSRTSYGRRCTACSPQLSSWRTRRWISRRRATSLPSARAAVPCSTRLMTLSSLRN